MVNSKISRRRALASLGAISAGGFAGLTGIRASRAGGAEDPRFLIVLCASGGASIIDGPLAISEVDAGAAAPTLNCFPEVVFGNLDPSIPFRAIDASLGAVGPIPVPFTTGQQAFIESHHQDMLVATLTSTSVNHQVAQSRAVTGNSAWRGRTIQEAVANQYGAAFPLPNVHLATGTAFTQRGADSSLPAWAYGEQVASPALWPLALDGSRGTSHPVDSDVLATARALRNDVLDVESQFNQAFAGADGVRNWTGLRGSSQAAIEQAELIDKLLFVPDAAPYNLGARGLSPSPDAELVRAAFPNYDWDPLHAQAALAFLLIKNRVSVTVTLGNGFDLVLEDGTSLGGGGLPEGSMANPPIGFDFSHQGHRSTQAFMWSRIYEVAGGLITLLQGEEWRDGESLWDRTMIYVATDFGRSKGRPSNAGEWGTGHDLNNGIVLLSPMVSGNTVLGGVNATTGMTHGFDPGTGEVDEGREMTEEEIFGGMLGVMGIDTNGETDSMPAMEA
ncbi:MAG: hypothetical protein ACE37F_02170 [Nannocystaceae bacterium]|nr:DUF1501 domain-containing protein [bacterium]